MQKAEYEMAAAALEKEIKYRKAGKRRKEGAGLRGRRRLC